MSERESLLPARLETIARREYDRTLDPDDAHRLLELIEAAEAFVRTTSVFRQNKSSRDKFERLSLALAGVLEGGS